MALSKIYFLDIFEPKLIGHYLSALNRIDGTIFQFLTDFDDHTPFDFIISWLNQGLWQRNVYSRINIGHTFINFENGWRRKKSKNDHKPQIDVEMNSYSDV